MKRYFTRKFVPSMSGFTLIELLVVIAIIGLLSSVVLASLNAARNKAKDAAIISELHQLANLAELAYSDGGTYLPLQPNWWVKVSDPTCSDAAYSGNYASRATEICRKILADAGTTCYGAQLCFYSGVNSASFGGQVAAYQKYYSFMAYLPGESARNGVATFACVGASGGRYIGTDITWNGIGCYNNP